jgi:hypothetical protein
MAPILWRRADCACAAPVASIVPDSQDMTRILPFIPFNINLSR